MLTKSQKAIIENIARLSGEIKLYRETSMSGKSETLRYYRRWVEHGRWGPSPRSQSHMVLSVAIKVLPSGSDDPASLAKYEALCKEAEEYYQSLLSNTACTRQGVDSALSSNSVSVTPCG